MPKVCEFFKLTRKLLEERLTLLRQEETPTWTDIRHFFYECRNKYLRENPERLEIDSTSKAPYVDFEKTIKRYCQKHSPEFDIPEELWWRLRERLNIWPEARATCEGKSGKFLIDRENRERVSESCSFVLFCEKRTVSRELLERLRGEGYELNIVATGGHSPADVQEAVILIGEDLDDDPTFYCLILHDYDLDGVKILFTLRERYKGVIDVGVNRAFVQYWAKQEGFDMRLVEEQKLNKNHQGGLREKMRASEDYGLEDFDYLQGEQIGEKRWRGKRIEIDAIHVEYGIQPFIDYIMNKIREECKVWDLGRIGVWKFDLKEPPNHYEEVVKSIENMVGRAYGRKLHKLSKPLNTILEIVTDTLTQPPKFAELEKKYRGEGGAGWSFPIRGTDERYTYRSAEVEGVAEIKEEYEEQIQREWAEDYEDELGKINEQVSRYEGDVRKGEEDLKKRRNKLQETLEEDKQNDPDLDPFTEKLDEVEWGKEELEDIPEPDEADDVRKVIDTLQERLKELEEAA